MQPMARTHFPGFCHYNSNKKKTEEQGKHNTYDLNWNKNENIGLQCLLAERANLAVQGGPAISPSREGGVAARERACQRTQEEFISPCVVRSPEPP